MTAPSEETLEREKDKLYLLDAELIRRLGVPDKVMRSMLLSTARKFVKPLSCLPNQTGPLVSPN